MIRLLFNLSYFQLNLDPGIVSVKSWETLHLIKFSQRFKRYVKMKIWSPLISEGSSRIVKPWKSHQRTFLLKITTKFSSYQFRQGNHSAKCNEYDIKMFSRNMSLTSIGYFNRGRPPISLNSEKIAYFWFNQPNNCFFLFRFLCARHFKFRACSRAKSKLKISQS